MNKLKQYQIKALIVTIGLILFSIYIVFDASNAWAKYKYNDEYFYLKKQCVYALIAIIALFCGKKINIRKYRKFLLPAMIFCFFLLVLVLIPGIGIYKGGSYSWLGFSFFSFQPSELFKIISILFIAYYLDNKFFSSEKVKTFLPIILIIFIATILIMLQPDFGTLIVYLGAVFIMLFLSKLPIKYFIFCLLVGSVSFALMIVTEPYRLQRITSYVDPFSDPLGSGFQIIQSMFAVGPGGLIGNGINQSIQKYYYLPEPMTDFIFSIIVEEIGLLGGIIILFVYGYLFYLLYKISIYKHDRFNFLYSIGILALIVIQVIINLGVVTALFPVTGITLPFLSYGGSSLITLSFGVGLIIGGRNENTISCV